MLVSEKRRLREAEILSCLNKLKVVDVRVLMKLNVGDLGKGSKRNCLRVMNEMVRDGLVRSVRKEVKLFYDVEMRGIGNWEHTLMRNRFIAEKGRRFYEEVKIEPRVILKGKEVRPDMLCNEIFYEVDRTQKMKVNREKIRRYIDGGVKFEIVCGQDRINLWKGYVYNIVS